MPIKYPETGRRTLQSNPVHLESIHPEVVVPVTFPSGSSVTATAPNIKSVVNSTTTPLGAGATWTGEWESIAAYTTITVNGGSDVAGTLYIDFSTIASAAVKAFDEGGTDRTSEMVVGTTPVTGGLVVTVSLKYPATSGPGRYSLEFLLTLSTGAVLEFDYTRVSARDLTA